MNICIELQKYQPETKYINKELLEKYSSLVIKILDETESIKDVYTMLTEKCFNKKEVIDLVSKCNLQIILNHEKVGRVVNDFWEGPFETQFFMND